MSIIYRSFMMFDFIIRKRLIQISVLQLILGALDLVGVAVIGIIGALSVAGVKSQIPEGTLYSLISITNLDKFSFQLQIAILGILAVFILVTKTVISAIFTKKIFQFLGAQGAELSAQIMKSILSKSILFTKTRNIQELIYISSSGTNALSIGVLGGAITLLADISLTIIIGCALLVIDPFIAILTYILFGVVLYALNRATSENSINFGKKFAEYSIQSNSLFEESLGLFREIKLSNHNNHVVSNLHSLRRQLSSTAAEVAFLPNLSKYVIESSILIGALFICAFQFLAQDSSHAVATLAVFIAAGTRIAPALLRIQQSILVIKNSSGTALGTVQLISELQEEPDNLSSSLIKTDVEFLPVIKTQKLSFKFSNSGEYLLSNLSFEIKPGSRVAIVGPSGSGKTTLVDLLLGIIPPSSGTVHVSGINACDASRVWPGAIGYVPQDVWLIDGSIRENILLGWEGAIGEIELESIVNLAQLTQTLQELPLGLETKVGTNGQSLSGGQRQRIGIARALLTKPKLLVLDEATSALDSNSENLISKSISKLEKGTTVLMIAHRLVSIKDFQRVIYIDKGTILADGTFAEVRSQLPDFDNQADLLGL